MREMRRSDRKMSTEEAFEVLRNGEYGILSTVDDGGKPYGVPLSYAFIDKSIYFHCANEGSKLDNIKNSSCICFTVVGKTKILPDKFSTDYESVIVFGRASLINDDEKILGLREIIRKYSPDFMQEGEEYIQRAKDKTCVVKIDIENITGKHRM